MKKKPTGSGTIVSRDQGSKRYYYYSVSYREKIDPGASGKKKGSGKSRVVTKRIYLGEAEDVMRSIRESRERQEPVEVESRDFGLPVALFEMAERIGLRDGIDTVIPGKVRGINISDFILVAAINRVGNHTSKEKMGQWYRNTELSELRKIKALKLNSKNFWYAFDKLVSEKEIKEKKESLGVEPNGKIDIDVLEEVVDDSKIEAVEEILWGNLCRRFGFLLDVVLYDTTNFYNYHQPDTGNCLSQFGKNKQNQNDKRQVGLQLGIVKEVGIPIFHNLYCGHQNDATLFPTAIRKLMSRYRDVMKGTEKLVMVFDKGNNSAENISALGTEQIDFVGALTPHHHKDLVQIGLDQFKERSGKYLLYRTKKVVFGAERTILITYNPATAKRQEELFERHMKGVMKEAKAYFDTISSRPTSEVRAMMETFLKTQKVVTSQALRFYEFSVEHNGWVNKFFLRRRRSEVEIKKLSFGKKIIFTTLDSESNEGILSLYKSAHQIEESFHHIKDRDIVPYGPAYHWTDSKLRVHAFVCVLALLLLKLIHYTARANGMEMSVSVLMDELKDIRMVIIVYPDGKAVRKVEKLSTVQSRLFDVLSLQKYG